MKMDDRRKAERTPVERSSNAARLTKTAIFGVTNLETDLLMGHLINVTPLDLQMTTYRPVEVRSIFNFRLRLPEPIQGSVFIVVNAECTSCKQGTDERSYTSGFKLDSITPSNLKRIQALLVSLGKIEQSVTG